MIKTVKLLSYILLFLLISCMDNIPLTISIIENKSDYNIEIKGYEKHKLIQSITIKSKDEYCIKDRLEVVLVMPYPTDSIEIIYENKKKAIQFCNGERLFANSIQCKFEDNIMEFGNKKLQKFPNRAIKKITFDNSDYEKAISF
jgi:hypothetical protein